MIIATIPARGGSKGILNKNTIDVGGYPLISYSIAAAKLSKKIDRVIVSTDSKEIAHIASKFGAEVPFLRPSEYAKDTSKDDEHILHMLNWIKENENIIPDLLIHLRPTTPIRDPLLLDCAINKILKQPNATSLRSAHECPESPHKWFKLKDDFFKGFIIDDMDHINLPRQNFPIAYIPNGYVDIIIPEKFLKTSRLHGGSVLSFITPPCIEIDSMHELNMLRLEMQTNTSIIKKLHEAINEYK